MYSSQQGLDLRSGVLQAATEIVTHVPPAEVESTRDAIAARFPSARLLSRPLETTRVD
jgi:hypothetical protein